MPHGKPEQEPTTRQRKHGDDASDVSEEGPCDSMRIVINKCN
jgi:hypothetical protein